MDSDAAAVRSDLMLDFAAKLLDAFAARRDGDLERASVLTEEAAIGAVEVTGLDDDFPIFWIEAVESAMAVGNAERAQGLIRMVTDAPPGHRPLAIQAHLPRLRAIVAIAAGNDDTVESDLVAARGLLLDFGAPYYAARTELDLARWLVQHGRAAEAEPLLTSAAAAFEALGAKPWLDAVAQVGGLVGARE
jgi:hypothetical protein